MASFDDYLRQLPVELRRALQAEAENSDQIAAGKYAKTSGVENIIHQLYGDGENGSDSWDGLTANTPKRSLGALAAMLPEFVRDSVTLNIRNKFSLTGSDIPTIGSVGFYVGEHVYTTGGICLDGGSDVDEVAGPWIADIYAVDQIGKASLTMTPDEYTGWWLEIVTGPMAGRRIAIWCNDATTFYPIKNFTVDPGPATFRLVEPHTEIWGEPGLPSNYLVMGVAGTCRFRTQRLKITGEAFINSLRTSQLMLAQTIQNSTKHIQIINTGELYGSLGQDPITGAILTGEEPGMCVAGFSVVAPSTPLLIADSGVYGLLYSIIKCDLNITGCHVWNYILWHGTRITGKLSFKNSSCIGPLAYPDSASWRVPRIGGLGLYSNGEINVQGPLEISNSPSHAIEIDNSDLKVLAGVISGSGNGGMSCYAHGGGHMSFASGHTPTVVGTGGEVSLDGSTEKSTWAAIAAGTPINGATVGNDEFAIVKKV